MKRLEQSKILCYLSHGDDALYQSDIPLITVITLITPTFTRNDSRSSYKFQHKVFPIEKFLTPEEALGKRRGEADIDI